jgi:soluble epoxide hydrolase / lipid-phosphate phosphatase
MSGFPRKSFTVPSTRHTYDYIRIPASTPSKPTIAFLHGFPAIAFGWRHQIKYFAEKGYGIIAPDMLGFGGSSTPEDPKEYRSKMLVEDIMALLDHEGIDTYHGVGHDAGSWVLGRFYNYNPRRLLSVTFIAVPYGAPGVRFSIDAMNAWTKNVIGFEKFAYMQFLASDRSHILIEQHVRLSL